MRCIFISIVLLSSCGSNNFCFDNMFVRNVLEETKSSRLKLYELLKEGGLYSDNYEEFQITFSDSVRVKKLYNILSEKKYYTKTYNEFEIQFFDRSTKLDSINDRIYLILEKNKKINCGEISKDLDNLYFLMIREKKLERYLNEKGIYTINEFQNKIQRTEEEN